MSDPGTERMSPEPSTFPFTHSWDYLVRSFEGDAFMLETVHRGENSLRTELGAIERIGRRAEVYVATPDGRWVRKSAVGETKETT